MNITLVASFIIVVGLHFFNSTLVIQAPLPTEQNSNSVTTMIDSSSVKTKVTKATVSPATTHHDLVEVGRSHFSSGMEQLVEMRYFDAGFSSMWTEVTITPADSGLIKDLKRFMVHGQVEKIAISNELSLVALAVIELMDGQRRSSILIYDTSNGRVTQQARVSVGSSQQVKTLTFSAPWGSVSQQKMRKNFQGIMDPNQIQETTEAGAASGEDSSLAEGYLLFYSLTPDIYSMRCLHGRPVEKKMEWVDQPSMYGPKVSPVLGTFLPLVLTEVKDPQTESTFIIQASVTVSPFTNLNSLKIHAYAIASGKLGPPELLSSQIEESGIFAVDETLAGLGVPSNSPIKVFSTRMGDLCSLNFNGSLSILVEANEGKVKALEMNHKTPVILIPLNIRRHDYMASPKQRQEDFMKREAGKQRSPRVPEATDQHPCQFFLATPGGGAKQNKAYLISMAKGPEITSQVWKSVEIISASLPIHNTSVPLLIPAGLSPSRNQLQFLSVREDGSQFMVETLNLKMSQQEQKALSLTKKRKPMVIRFLDWTFSSIFSEEYNADLYKHINVMQKQIEDKHKAHLQKDFKDFQDKDYLYLAHLGGIYFFELLSNSLTAFIVIACLYLLRKIVGDTLLKFGIRHWTLGTEREWPPLEQRLRERGLLTEQDRHRRNYQRLLQEQRNYRRIEEQRREDGQEEVGPEVQNDGLMLRVAQYLDRLYANDRPRQGAQRRNRSGLRRTHRLQFRTREEMNEALEQEEEEGPREDGELTEAERRELVRRHNQRLREASLRNLGHRLQGRQANRARARAAAAARQTQQDNEHLFISEEEEVPQPGREVLEEQLEEQKEPPELPEIDLPQDEERKEMEMPRGRFRPNDHIGNPIIPMPYHRPVERRRKAPDISEAEERELRKQMGYELQKKMQRLSRRDSTPRNRFKPAVVYEAQVARERELRRPRVL